MTIELRTPTERDAPAIGAMLERAWREAYDHLISEVYWQQRDTAAIRERFRRRLADPPPGEYNLMAVRPGADGEETVVGWVSSGPARSAQAGIEPARDRELYSIYTLADEYGTGLGQRLLEAVLAAGEPAELWQFEANPRARAFYARNGFTPDGTRHLFTAPSLELPEIRLVR